MDPEYSFPIYDPYLRDEMDRPLALRPPRADDPAYSAPTPDATGSEDTFGDTSRYFLDRSIDDVREALSAFSEAEGVGERLLQGLDIPIAALEGLGAQGLAALSEVLPMSVTHPHLSPDQAERDFVETFLYEVPEATAGRVPAALPGAAAMTEHRLRRAAGDFTDQYPSDELGYFHSAYVPSRVHLQQMTQPGYQFNPAEVSYVDRMDEAYRMRDAGATNPEIFEQTRIMLVPQRDESGNIIEEVALTATPRVDAYPTQVEPNAQARVQSAASQGYEEEVGDLIDFGPDVQGLYPGGRPRSPVFSERLAPNILGGYDPIFETITISDRARHRRDFPVTLAHEGEHDLQEYSGLLPTARGTNPDVMPGGNPAERFSMYEANLGEMLARRAMGDDTTAAAAGIMEALNPFLRTSTHLPDLRRGELIPRFTARVPANIFEGNRNPQPVRRGP